MIKNKDIKDLANWVIDNVDFRAEPLVFKNWGECEIVMPDLPIFFKNEELQDKLEHTIAKTLIDRGEFKDYEKDYKLIY